MQRFWSGFHFSENLLRKTIIILIALMGAVFLFAETVSSKKKSSPKSAAKVGVEHARPKSSSKKKTTASKKTPARKPTWRSTQRTPTPERYKEIQRALADKGYLQSGSPNGVWNASSVEALKRFQSDQNLEASGKIDSLSLIALGLGPKRDAQPAPRP